MPSIIQKKNKIVDILDDDLRIQLKTYEYEKKRYLCQINKLHDIYIQIHKLLRTVASNAMNECTLIKHSLTWILIRYNNDKTIQTDITTSLYNPNILQIFYMENHNIIGYRELSIESEIDDIHMKYMINFMYRLERGEPYAYIY
jgi:hypothetical protein